jgi:hypothetical protein
MYYKQQNGGTIDLSISYDNFDNETKRNMKNQYGKYLKMQMKERDFKKQEELANKRREEMIEEERIKKEREEMERRARIEEQKRKEELEKYRVETEKLLNSVVILPNKRKEHNIRTQEIITQEQLDYRKKELQVFNDNIYGNLEKMRNQLIENNNLMFKNLNLIREENTHGSLYKVDLHREINDLRQELHRKRFQESLQKDYLFKSLADSKYKSLQMENYFNKNDLCLNKSLNLVNQREQVTLENNRYNDIDEVENNQNELIRISNRRNHLSKSTENTKEKVDISKILMRNEGRLYKLKHYSEYS